MKLLKTLGIIGATILGSALACKADGILSRLNRALDQAVGIETPTKKKEQTPTPRYILDKDNIIVPELENDRRANEDRNSGRGAPEYNPTDTQNRRSPRHNAPEGMSR